MIENRNRPRNGMPLGIDRRSATGWASQDAPLTRAHLADEEEFCRKAREYGDGW